MKGGHEADADDHWRGFSSIERPAKDITRVIWHWCKACHKAEDGHGLDAAASLKVEDVFVWGKRL